MTKYSRVFRRAAFRGYTRNPIFSVGCGLSSFYGMPGTAAPTESSCPTGLLQGAPRGSLLDNDLLLLRIHPALRRLRGHRNYSFSGRQRRREVMETAVWVD